MTEQANIENPRSLGSALALNEAGEVDMGLMRPFTVNGQTYVTTVQNGGQVAVPVNNAGMLQKDEWISYDQAVRSVQEQRRACVADLESRGLVYNAGDLGATIAEWEASSDMDRPEISMDGATPTTEDAQTFALAGVPIPVIRKDFRINVRRLLASRRMGGGVDVSQAQVSSRLVTEESEKLLLNGHQDLKVGTYTIYGYTTHPQRQTHSLGDWVADPANILTDVEAMIKKLEDARHYGPFMLYVAGDLWAELRKDYKAESERTALQRVRDYAEIEDVKVSGHLDAGTCVMVQLTSEVIDMARAQAMITVQWESGDGFTSHFGVLEAWAPRLKPDYNDRLGVCHGS